MSGNLPSSASVWSGRILSGLTAAFLAFDGVAKILLIQPVLDASAPLQIPIDVIPFLGTILTAFTVMYVIPMTSIIGAVALTAYLGAASWTHIRLGGDLFPMIFPVIVGILMWFGLWLRDPRLRLIFPVRG